MDIGEPVRRVTVVPLVNPIKAPEEPRRVAEPTKTPERIPALEPAK